MKKEQNFHGSDIEKIASFYQIPTEEIIDFASNVNPLGLSPMAKDALLDNIDIITKYPDRNYTSLKREIAHYCNVPKEFVTVGNGSTELISIFTRLMAPKKALVIRPTYSEYERELSLSGAELSYYFLEEKNDFKLDIEKFISQLNHELNLIVLCNPNNPTGLGIETTDLERIIAHCKKYKIALLIDETYVEFSPAHKNISALSLVEKYDNFMVIRGVSKFYSSPGLRFGYGITSSKEFIHYLRREQNPWSLNSIGAFMGEIMLKDIAYIQETKELIWAEKSRIQKELSRCSSLHVFDTDSNFFLVKLLKEGLTSDSVFEEAIKNRLMLRNCCKIEGLNGEFIRFCIRSPKENDKLLSFFKKM
ncbi:threonine-phosphate decarboxylase [Aequitasia blattaphilus]|uniref:Aminotransferase class I/II-fold pyridoxal phosphate-dependent enzyme n=1 Tax=Aequitasia blattaphilus TaxID=2949332 RepID=A0ABT1EEY1_9FIRM|nr:histidinol-phosphate transaminase [Aequitasia blattaphilus]MCP1103401.1 aminotransferase class I/II-fold pyridoxal phosphate-dependent enzyme [Aequitasia blattaphilus]MCR8616041.1 aminotransferase class I/II-fold pyridoxal phosphate-dependent enzyme [Aequitasia blattaphilus]